jgi:glucosylglycerate synthase
MNVIEDNPQGIARADIVVGIPSFNEAEHIAFPTQRVDKGLSQYFGRKTGVIINCDNASPDDTRRAFMETPTKHPKIYLSTPSGIKGKGRNLRNLFEKAVELSAEAVIVADADLTNITPRWIRNLAEPLFQDFQYVVPLYVRHKYEGAVTNNIAYPLTRALYGRRIRQPIGGEFGFSGQLARVFLESDGWTESVANFGIDVWMTTTAMRNRKEVIQSFMGGPRIHSTSDGTTLPVNIFRDVVETSFELMCRYEEFWKEVKWSRPTAVFGFGLGEVEVPPPVELNLDSLWNEFTAGMQAHWDSYRTIVQPETLGKLEEVAGLSREGFEFPAVLWARILYDFACAHKSGIAGDRDLPTVLMPLFFGKTLSFVGETEQMNTHQVEEYIEDQCLQFEKTKPYLLERWFSG